MPCPLAWGFAVLVSGSLLIVSGSLVPRVAWMLIATIAATSVGIYALRGVYFALLAEGAVPLASLSPLYYLVKSGIQEQTPQHRGVATTA